jgi:hypothetical protein
MAGQNRRVVPCEFKSHVKPANPSSRTDPALRLHRQQPASAGNVAGRRLQSARRRRRPRRRPCNLLGIGGLLGWGFYLVTDEDRLAWGTLADLGVVVVLGLIMAARWIGVYRAYDSPDSSPSTVITVPPERHFPRSVVAIHGLLAASAVVLVVLSLLFDGS